MSRASSCESRHRRQCRPRPSDGAVTVANRTPPISEHTENLAARFKRSWAPSDPAGGDRPRRGVSAPGRPVPATARRRPGRARRATPADGGGHVALDGPGRAVGPLLDREPAEQAGARNRRRARRPTRTPWPAPRTGRRPAVSTLGAPGRRSIRLRVSLRQECLRHRQRAHDHGRQPGQGGHVAVEDAEQQPAGGRGRADPRDQQQRRTGRLQPRVRRRRRGAHESDSSVRSGRGRMPASSAAIASAFSRSVSQPCPGSCP